MAWRRRRGLFWLGADTSSQPLKFAFCQGGSYVGSVSHGPQVNLFGIDTRKRKAVKKTEPAPPGVIQNLISVYKQGYERRFNEPPVVLKSDGPLLKNLVKQFGAVKVEQRLRAFMAWDDQFVVDSGFSLRMLHTRWNALAAKCVQERPAERGAVPSADATSAYLQRLKSVVR
jgi:hypothetical protein